MDEHDLALEITRLKMRAQIHQILLLQLRLLLPVATKGVSLGESQRLSLQALEEIGTGLERDLFSTERFGPMTDSERALYADELREIVEEMKSSTGLLTDAMKGNK